MLLPPAILCRENNYVKHTRKMHRESGKHNSENEGTMNPSSSFLITHHTACAVHTDGNQQSQCMYTNGSGQV